MSNIKLSDIREYPAKERKLLDVTSLTSKEMEFLRRKGTLCWNCNHAKDLQCPWFQGFQPVDGWIVEKGFKKYGYPSNLILDCPMFIPDPPRQPISLSTKTVEATSKAKDKKRQYIAFQYNRKAAMIQQEHDQIAEYDALIKTNQCK